MQDAVEAHARRMAQWWTRPTRPLHPPTPRTLSLVVPHPRESQAVASEMERTAETLAREERRLQESMGPAPPSASRPGGSFMPVPMQSAELAQLEATMGGLQHRLMALQAANGGGPMSPGRLAHGALPPPQGIDSGGASELSAPRQLGLAESPSPRPCLNQSP